MPSRKYLRGQLAILDELLQRRYAMSAATQDWAESTRTGLKDQLAALPPDPAPYCQACGNTLDGCVAPEEAIAPPEPIVRHLKGKVVRRYQAPPIAIEAEDLPAADGINPHWTGRADDSPRREPPAPPPVDWPVLVNRLDLAIRLEIDALMHIRDRQHGRVTEGDLNKGIGLLRAELMAIAAAKGGGR